MEYRISANLEEIAAKLGSTRNQIDSLLKSSVERLSISTHAYVVEYAERNLHGFMREEFFGEKGRNVRWTEVSDGFWVVEIDESVAWIEEGRDPTFMGDWLLKGDKVKTAKDGSKYRVIPFSHSRGNKIYNENFITEIKEAAKTAGINLNTVDKGSDGNPKLGMIGKLQFSPGVTMGNRDTDRFFSKSRGEGVAKALGLKPYSGKHYLDNAIVTQRQVGKFVKKEVVTFRVISSKHKGEGRWMYPAVPALNSIPAAFDYASKEWEKIMRSLEEHLAK